MANFIVPRTRRVIQIRPRVLKEDRDCCSCINWTGTCGNQEGSSRFCSIQGKQMSAYDECSAFEIKKDTDAT